MELIQARNIQSLSITSILQFLCPLTVGRHAYEYTPSHCQERNYRLLKQKIPTSFKLTTALAQGGRLRLEHTS